MRLSRYEQRLKNVNPKLHIKRFGQSKATIHYGNIFVCRIGQGCINPYNEFTIRNGFSDQYKTALNPQGEYRYRLMVKRGRAEAAKILYTQKRIKFNQIAGLS